MYRACVILLIQHLNRLKLHKSQFYANLIETSASLVSKRRFRFTFFVMMRFAGVIMVACADYIARKK